MVVLTKDYTIKNLSKEYDVISVTAITGKLTFVCNKGFIRKNTNLVVITEGSNIDKKSVLRSLFKQYRYKLKQGKVTSRTFTFGVTDTDEYMQVVSNCWIFKLADISKLYPRVKKTLVQNISLHTIFMVRDNNNFGLTNMRNLKQGYPFVTTKNSVKSFIQQHGINTVVENKDLKVYMLTGKLNNILPNLQIGKHNILQTANIQKPKSLFRKMFNLPAKTEKVQNNDVTFSLLNLINYRIGNISSKPLAVIATVSYDNIMIDRIYNLNIDQNNPQMDDETCRNIAELTGWYYTKDVLIRK